ncbi:MAG TPA: ABC transporter ATP-binding protein [Polyangiaceae bacterium]|nr:ABC transporter ATP-binding protein [Polyangiaceae bacterium]
MAIAAIEQARGVGVRIAGLHRRFQEVGAVIDGVDLDIAPGEFVALLGPSGCGKSTLLRLVAGLDRPDAGAITLTSPAHDGGVAFVFQDAHLLPWRNVVDNAALPLELEGVGATERRARARAVLADLGLGEAGALLPRELSGGMRMRVSLARALVTGPALLLLDEPFAALDELNRQRLDDQLRTLWSRLGLTVLFVTHSVDEATYLADRAIVLSSRPARVVLDRSLDLPAARDVGLRTEPSFARECRTLRDALERGGA